MYRDTDVRNDLDNPRGSRRHLHLTKDSSPHVSHLVPPPPLRASRGGLTVAAASTAGTLLGATPAYAATPVTTSVANGGSLLINGTISGDSVTASLTGGTVKLENLLGSITAGPGCEQQGAVVLCNGITAMTFSGFAGDDTFATNTAIRSFLIGQSGNNRLTGGSGNNVIDGGRGSDAAFGKGGAADRCTAESESTCEI